jgi:hypothetical protein
MASRSPGDLNNLIYIKFRRFNNLLSSSGKSMFGVAVIFLNKQKHKNVLKRSKNHHKYSIKNKFKKLLERKLSQTTYHISNLINTL